MRGMRNKTRTRALLVSTPLMLCLVFKPGCSIGGNFLGLEDYQRDLLFGLGSLALQLLLPQEDPQVAGSSCWDLNGNAVGDADEDKNNDGLFDALDCVGATGATGQQGPPGTPGQDGQDGNDGNPGPAGPAGQDGQDGLNCWDLDGDGVQDEAEDINNDGEFDAQDCQGQGGGGQQGPAGPSGPAGPAGPQGPAGPTLCNTFIDDFFGVNEVATAEALEQGAVLDGPIPTKIEEPALGNCEISSDTIAYKVGVSEFCNPGNPITMRLFFWREGTFNDNCFVLRLDAFKASHGTGISHYGDTRYIRLNDPPPAVVGDDDDDATADGVLLVVDLPLNVALGSGLGFPNTLQPGDLLAFELNTLNEFLDGRCYTILGAEFFETQAGDPVSVEHALVYTSLDQIDCGEEVCTPETCNDGDPCTTDSCVENICVHTPVVCDDENDCTSDSCDGGECFFAPLPVGEPCDDLDACTSSDGTEGGADACDGQGECLGTPVVCNDQNQCTSDACQGGECVYSNLPEGSPCDDENFCTSFEGVDPGPDGCNGEGECLGTPIEQTTTCPNLLEVVFLMDTSDSMLDEEMALCEAIPNIVAAVQANLGAETTVNSTLWGITADSGDFVGQFTCLASDVLDELGPVVPGDNGACSDLLDDGPTAQAEQENWGSAVAVVSQSYAWPPPGDGVRIIIPVSDEGPCFGGNNTPHGCGAPDQDSIENAIAIANLNNVTVSPVIGQLTGAPMCIFDLANQLATGTGGSAFFTTDPQMQLTDAIVGILLDACTTFCADEEAAQAGGGQSSGETQPIVPHSGVEVTEDDEE